jgi:3-methyladenine DNA glycosylase AlkD
MDSDLNIKLLNMLKDVSDPKIKEWWEGYVKESAPFLGVNMATIRKIVHQWYEEQIKFNIDADQQLNLALSLIEGKYTEEKLAGFLFLQEILLPLGEIQCDREIDRFEELFISGYIYDWNVCDWFCVKVLGPLIEKEGKNCAKQIIAWHRSENLWVARASLVSFVPVADCMEYYHMMEQAIAVVIKRPERFAKTAVGWLLRDISKHDKKYVDMVVTENIGHFSLECLQNATKYFSKQEKTRYKQMLKDAKTGL